MFGHRGECPINEEYLQARRNTARYEITFRLCYTNFLIMKYVKNIILINKCKIYYINIPGFVLRILIRKLA